MIKKIKKIAFLTTVLLSSFGTVSASIIDNRFIPWYPRTMIRTVEKRSFLKVSSFFITGNGAYGNEAKENKGIPEVYGDFDQKVFGQALEAAGKENHLSVDWQRAHSVIWNTLGKLQGQGAEFNGEYALTNNFSVGFTGAFMHLTSNQRFVMPQDTSNSLFLTASDRALIDQQRRDMLKEVGFDSSEWSDSSLSDLVFYTRFGGVRDYVMKFRQADFSFYFGGIVPTANKRDTSNPAAIPFGGGGLPGIMFGFDTHLEVKEDLWFSCASRISQRFKKTQERRIPLKGEPEIFGAIVGDVAVDPGVTVMVSPAVTFTDIQGGLGAQLQYVYNTHFGDVWEDKRAVKTPAIDISKIYSERTKWSSEYVLFQLRYDFDKVSSTKKKLSPLVTFSWDIPVSFFGPEHVAEVQKIGLAVVFQF